MKALSMGQFVRLTLAFVVTISIGCFVVLSDSNPVSAWSTSFVAPGAPYNGSWGYRSSSSCSGSASDSTTVPPSHHYFNGNFGVDYYACSGTPGKFYSWDPNVPGNSNASHGYVTSVGGSCSDPQDWKGYQYRIDLYNNTGGNRGMYDIMHVYQFGYSDGVLYGAYNSIYSLPV